PAPVLAGLGLVDSQGAAADLLAVEGADRLVAAVGHLDEAEAARTAGFAVGDDLGTGHGAVLREQLAQVVGGRLEGQVADVDVLPKGPPPRPGRPAATGYANAAAPARSYGGKQSLSGKAWRSREAARQRSSEQRDDKTKRQSRSTAFGMGTRPPNPCSIA